MEVNPQSIAQRFVTRFHYLVFNVHLRRYPQSPDEDPAGLRSEFDQAIKNHAIVGWFQAVVNFAGLGRLCSAYTPLGYPTARRFFARSLCSSASLTRDIIS